MVLKPHNQGFDMAIFSPQTYIHTCHQALEIQAGLWGGGGGMQKISYRASDHVQTPEWRREKKGR